MLMQVCLSFFPCAPASSYLAWILRLLRYGCTETVAWGQLHGYSCRDPKHIEGRLMGA